MQFLAWSDTYSVHVKSMDAQHKQLVDLVNQLYESMKSGRGDQATNKILSLLAGYTREHFTDEEKLMQANGFPGYLQHKALHDMLTRQVVDLQRQCQTGKAKIGDEVLRFLKDWLTKHIVGSDQNYGQFLNAKGIN